MEVAAEVMLLEVTPLAFVYCAYAYTALHVSAMMISRCYYYIFVVGDGIVC